MGRGGVYRLMLGHTDDKSKSYNRWSWVRPEPNLGSLFLGARITARSTKNAHDPQSWIRPTLRHPAIEAPSNDWIARLIACSYPALCPTRAGAQDVPGRRPGMVFSTSSLPPPKANSTSFNRRVSPMPGHGTSSISHKTHDHSGESRPRSRWP